VVVLLLYLYLSSSTSYQIKPPLSIALAAYTLTQNTRNLTPFAPTNLIISSISISTKKNPFQYFIAVASNLLALFADIACCIEKKIKETDLDSTAL
jgi:hypothetical protein